MHHYGPIIVKGFSTKNNIKLAEKYYAAHIALLKKHRLLQVFHSATDLWLKNETVYGILIMTKDEKTILGGARIECFTNRNQLPIYQLIGSREPKLDSYIKSLNGKIIGEISGVWKADIARSFGVNVKLILKSLFCLAKQIPLNYVFGLSSHKIFTPSNELGAKKVKTLGNDGIFYYTKYKIPAAVYYFEPIESVPTAFIEDRIIMEQLMANPILTIDEKYKGKTIEINYHLTI